MKNLKPAHRILPIIFFIFLFCINIFSQVEIKERVEINPGTGTMNPLISGCTFGNCSYYDCDSSEIYIRFTPASVEPGESTLMKLWIVDSLYEYNEENYDIIQKTITIEPECGQLTYFGVGEYLFTAPDTLTVDSFVVTINYENYNQFCAGWDAKGERMIIKDNFDCIDCPIPYLSILWRDYASGQITIKWDSLDVRVEPDTIYPGDTAQVVIKKRLPDGTFTDFDSTQTYEVGWPIYGPPNGFGLMQLDNTPAATERQLWNWKANVDGGKQKLNNIETAVDKYILKKGATNEEKYRLTNTFHDYHIGNYTYYYIWKERKWKVNPNRGYDNDEKSEYGNDVYIKYLELGGGN